MKLSFKSVAIGSMVLAVGSAHAQMNIVINPNASLSGNAAALAAFQRAANKWASLFSDPITVNINAGLASLGSGIIGSTSSVELSGTYTTIRNQMVTDAADEGASNAIVASLPTAAQFTALVASGSSLSGNVFGTKANLKALGFTGLDGSFGANDADITFSSNFNFDYDNSNGVAAGTMDFETIATHELGHALGFVSGAGDTGSIAPSTLDLYRFRTSNLPTNASQFTNNARSLTSGSDDSFSDTVNSWRMSTGFASGGDGRQTSHWKSDELTGTYIGVMDPTVDFGVIEPITNADIRAFDLIGYDLKPVPEPATMAVLGIGALAMIRKKRKQS